MAKVRLFAQDGSIVQAREVSGQDWLLKRASRVTALYLHGAYGGSVKLHAYLNINGASYSYVADFTDYKVMCDFVSKRRAWKNVSTSRV
jgi:hypothetical protein